MRLSRAVSCLYHLVCFIFLNEVSLYPLLFNKEDNILYQLTNNVAGSVAAPSNARHNMILPLIKKTHNYYRPYK